MATRSVNRFPRAGTLEQAPFSIMARTQDRIRAAEATAVARMPFDPRLLNAGGPAMPIHGGAIASLADFAACAAVWTLPITQRSATISMTVNYTGPGIGSDLIATARVRRSGSRVASLNVAIRDSQSALVADAMVTYKIA